MSEPAAIAKSGKPPSRRLLAEGLVCWFALIAVAMWADSHSGYALLALVPAVVYGLPLLLLHWLLPGLVSARLWFRRLRRALVPVLCGLLALSFGHESWRRGTPEIQFRKVTGIPVPAGISNLHTKLLFGPVGGYGGTYFEGPPSIVSALIEHHRLKTEPEGGAEFIDGLAARLGLPQPRTEGWAFHYSFGNSPSDPHLKIFSSTNGPSVYVFTEY